jgi:hypothetical protein
MGERQNLRDRGKETGEDTGKETEGRDRRLCIKGKKGERRKRERDRGETEGRDIEHSRSYGGKETERKR